jgi:beta-glucosidase-like glycosyl hydrolase
MKHFIGYEVPQPVKTERLVIPERILRQYDLTIYEAAIKAGSKSIMISSWRNKTAGSCQQTFNYRYTKKRTWI